MIEGNYELVAAPGKIIVKPDENERRSAGGLYIVSNARQSHGYIVAVYEDFEDPDTDAEVSAFYSVGDHVIYNPHSGAEVTVNNQRYLVLNEREILLKITETPDADNI